MKNFLLIIINGLLTLCEWFTKTAYALAILFWAALFAYSIIDFGECVLFGTDEVCLGD